MENLKDIEKHVHQPLVVGVLSAAAGPVSVPFVAGVHFAHYMEDPPSWKEEVLLGIEYGVGYYIGMELMARLFPQ